MQRRGAVRSTTKKRFSPSIRHDADDFNDKDKSRKLQPKAIIYVLAFVLFLVVCASTVLTPAQKQELAIAELGMEDWLLAKQQQQHPTPRQTEKEYHETNQNDGKDPEPIDPVGAEHEEEPLQLEEVEAPEQELQKKEEDHISPPDEAGLKRASSDAASARMEAQSSRWVDGERALRKKLAVLYDQQNKEKKYLGVPVLTRYLGEDIPAYIGTPDVTMKEEEWRELVKAKYEEMRQEEDDFRKKMESFIANSERDMGITTP
mmetsp:Transcript_13416/g.28431  ORF Transcript_13416/g.28431 Transcript_13416/m.28431 type:complete len:261 (-) Transcript_13416:389-1171(-)|eukprot:CAMPEP_0201117672 /NCGR_PEP_ID=MMETSP0850-20130426/1678_1 /ASSEMBLY_ACC=CAM_ASM_000622 /TAXON_ID=183588 /ORGANISM="Pseudo-nitzschia fraudulenta, Strain WWA7" /LENGTH=260 /DNA_ID=CAMNT_0047382185 /DNA_START=220 /DNA_END=1002 /DNA_ORIENTATION=+